MDIEILWEELRAQQLSTRDKASFEKFDNIFFQELLIALKSYNLTILNSTHLSLEQSTTLISSHDTIDLQKNLDQLQIALLHHASSIQNLIILITKIFEKAAKKPGSFTLFNPDHYLKILPKLAIFKEFIADRVTRYGQYISDLQSTDPDVFRGFNLIAKNAQKKFALHMFHTLVKLLPHILSTKSIVDKVSTLSTEILDKLQKETPDISKYQNIWLYLKQLMKDVPVNFIFSTIEKMGLAKYIGKNIGLFLAAKTDEIDENKLILHAVELADLSKNINFQLTSSYFIDSVKCTKIERLDQLALLLQTKELNLELNLELNITNINKILDLIELLTPINKSAHTGLKDIPEYNVKSLFQQSNVFPILAEIRKLIAKTPIKTLPDLQALQSILSFHFKKMLSLLEYSRAVANKKTRDIIKKLDQKIDLCNQYPNLESLLYAIEETNYFLITCEKTTPEFKSLFKSKLRELFLLLKNRIDILLTNQPTPELDQWDTFLLSGKHSPLFKNKSWANCFYAFTFTSTSPRFCALLGDQINGLNKLIAYEEAVKLIITSNGCTIPDVDSTELQKDRIVGIKHLQELVDSLQQQQKKLSAYILYLQFSAINSLFEKLSPRQTSPELNKIKFDLKNLILDIKIQAAQNNYNIILPHIIIINNLIRQIKNFDTESKHLSAPTKKEILYTLGSLQLFFYGDKHDKATAAMTKPREIVHVQMLSIFRRVTLNLIKFYENYVALIPEKISSVFKTTSIFTKPKIATIDKKSDDLCKKITCCFKYMSKMDCKLTYTSPPESFITAPQARLAKPT